jgi:hypothetical protein
MAKMKLADILKLAFGSKLDEEIDLDNDVDKDNKDESTVDKKEDVDKSNADDDKKEEETSDKEYVEDNKEEATEEKTEEVIKIFEDGWYDETSGNVNLEKIKNEEALEAIKLLTGKYQAEKDARLISDSLNDEIKNYSLNVSEDTLRKVLDTSGVKINEEGKVVGVKEALESLKKSEPGFFKDKEKESSPLNEGFNPVDKQTTLTEDEVVNLAYGQAE